METTYAKAEMLIRRPVEEVFNAFIDPAVTTQFWFTKSSGKLEEGKTINWTWEMYDVTVEVQVKKIELNKRIVIEWGNAGETTSVEWKFSKLPGGTFVSIINSGFAGEINKQIEQVRDSTEGFTLVLAGLKAWLEHGINLGLVKDRFPKEK